MPSHPIDFVSTSPVFIEGTNYLKTAFANIHYNDCKRTVIGNDVWVGTGVMIKDGLRIGDGAVIAAGAVVTHDVEAYTVVAGVPARFIRYRMNSKTMAESISKTEWWDSDIATLRELGYTFDRPSVFLNEYAKIKSNGKGDP